MKEESILSCASSNIKRGLQEVVERTLEIFDLCDALMTRVSNLSVKEP
jgi:hypothetical protein